MTRVMRRRLFPGRSELSSMWWGGGRLLPPFFHVPDGTGSMAGGGGASPRHIFGRGILELPHRRLFQTGDGLEVSFRHIMSDLAP